MEVTRSFSFLEIWLSPQKEDDKYVQLLVFFLKTTTAEIISFFTALEGMYPSIIAGYNGGNI